MRHPGSDFLRFHLPALAWTVWVGVLLGSPSTGELTLPDWVLVALARGGDKLIHWSLFLVLGWLGWRSLGQIGRVARPLRATVVGSLLYGAVLETLQAGIETRAVELGDYAANALGTLAAVGLIAYLTRRQDGLPYTPRSRKAEP